MIKKIIFVLLFLFILIATCFLAPNVSKNKQIEYLLIPQNATLSNVIDSLNQKESVYLPISFYFCAKLTKNGKNIKAGRYELTPKLSNLFLLNNLIKGYQIPLRITFNNIRTKEQLCGKICKQIMLDSAELHTLLSNEDFLEKYHVNSNNSVALFLPNTYEVYWDITGEDLINKMNYAYQLFWNNKRLELANKIGLTPTEVITLASIVEEESNLSKEKPTIAGLYLNRLRKRKPLEADPTIKFAIKDFSLKRIRHKHLEMAKSSPYSTYEHKGLPPGPIRIPSVASIDAVLNYEKHSYIYMCAKTDEFGHIFATSYREHVNNANRYRKKMNKLGVQ